MSSSFQTVIHSSGAAVTGDQAEHRRGLVVVVEIGPVHGHQDVAVPADLMRHPVRETVPNIDAVVAQQPIHLLDRVLGRQAPRLRQRLADRRHRQRGRVHQPERRIRQRTDPLGVQVHAIQTVDEGANILPARAHPTPFAHTTRPTNNPLAGLQNPRESRPDPGQVRMRGFVRVARQLEGIALDRTFTDIASGKDTKQNSNNTR